VLPFSLLQRTPGGKKPPAALIAEIPVALMIFDLLSFEDRKLIDEPHSTEKEMIETFPGRNRFALRRSCCWRNASELDPFFEQPRLRATRA